MLACWSFPLRSKCLGFLRPCWPWYENGSNSHKHATTGNRPRVFKRTQNVTSNNVGSCWPFARGLRLQTDETGFHQLDYQYGWYDYNLVKGCYFFLKASKGSLHRASVSGQHETVKELLESGQDVDQSDEVLVFFSLCKSNVMPSLSRSRHLRILFLHSE